MMETTTGKPNLSIFSETLIELGKKNKDLLVVTSDSRGSGKLLSFADKLPQQIIEVGIAEQNLVGVAAGLASVGKTVFAVSPASFLTARALEQIKNDVAYADNNVNLIGISSGISYGAIGATHHAIHDIAVLRCINNLTIVAPADNYEAREAIHTAAEYEYPVYIRFGKRALPNLHSGLQPFRIGSSIRLREGSDAAIITTGETLEFAIAAAEQLTAEGLSCRVISMHTIKPLDVGAVIAAAEECSAIVTVEEHSVYGGLGEACASVILQSGITVPFHVLGLPDEHLVNGNQLDVLNYYNISAEGIYASIVRLLWK